MKSIIYTLLRGIIFLVPAFVLMPAWIGDTGLWAAIPVAELLTMAVIVTIFMSKKRIDER